MATGVLGKIEEYDSRKEEWPQYMERLVHFDSDTAHPYKSQCNKKELVKMSSFFIPIKAP